VLQGDGLFAILKSDSRDYTRR